MRSQELKISLNVANKLSGKEGEELPVNLKFEKMKDFGPESVVEQVLELNKLLQLRTALQALKGPLGNIPAFRKKIEGLISDVAARENYSKNWVGTNKLLAFSNQLKKYFAESGRLMADRFLNK